MHELVLQNGWKWTGEDIHTYIHYTTLHYITLHYITLHTYTYIYMYIHIYIHIYIYPYTCIYIYIDIHSHVSSEAAAWLALPWTPRYCQHLKPGILSAANIGHGQGKEQPPARWQPWLPKKQREKKNVENLRKP